jgi:hypothetical protein
MVTYTKNSKILIWRVIRSRKDQTEKRKISRLKKLCKDICKLYKANRNNAYEFSAIFSAACRKLNVPRKLDKTSVTINSDKVFAVKCYRLLSRDLKIQNIPIIDSIDYLSEIVSIAKVSEKT